MDKFGVAISAVYVATKVGGSFSLKSRVPLALASNVVYKFTCSLDATTSYVGKTERHLITRAREHVDSSGQRTAVGDHLATCDSCQQSVSADILQNFSIIRHCTKFDVSYHEALIIKRQKPSLNVQLFRSGANKVLKVFY